MIGLEQKPIEILMVEDNPADVRLTREALRDWVRRNNLNVVRDGEEALAYLGGRDPYSESALPDLILLDLNLPRKDGRELLAEIKQDHRLRRIPVVVLTTSNAEQDVANAYDLHANCYIIKPVGLEEFIEAIRSIEAFWSRVATLPPPA